MKKITLQVQVIPTGPPPMTQQEKVVAQNRYVIVCENGDDVVDI